MLSVVVATVLPVVETVLFTVRLAPETVLSAVSVTVFTVPVTVERGSACAPKGSAQTRAAAGASLRNRANLLEPVMVLRMFSLGSSDVFIQPQG